MKHIGIALRISLRGSNHLREVQMKRAEEGKITSTNDLICAALERVYGGSFKPPKAHNYKWKVTKPMQQAIQPLPTGSL